MSNTDNFVTAGTKAAGISFALIIGAGVLAVLFNAGLLAYGTAALLITACVVASIRKLLSGELRISKEQLIYFLLVALLFAWLLTTISHNQDDDLYQDNIIMAIAQPLLMLVAILILQRGSANSFLQCIILIAIATTFGLLYELVNLKSLSAFGTRFRLSYLTIGMILALALLASISRLIATGKSSNLEKLIIVVLIGGLSLSLSRGAMLLASIAFFLVIPFAAIIKFGITAGFFKVVKLYALGTAVLGIILSVALNIERSRIKLLRMLDPAEELQAGGRGQLWQNTWQAIEKSPLTGHGIGTSGILSGNGADSYPHNIVLEAWAEGGLFAFILILSIIAMPFAVALLYWRNLRNDRNALALLTGTLYLSLEYMKSESLYTIHILFIWSIMFITLVTKSSEHGKVTR